MLDFDVQKSIKNAWEIIKNIKAKIFYTKMWIPWMHVLSHKNLPVASFEWVENTSMSNKDLNRKLHIKYI